MGIDFAGKENRRVKLHEEGEGKGKQGKRIKMLVSFLMLGIIVYIALFAVQIDLIERRKIKTVTVYTAAKDIRKGCKISKKEAEEYFIEEARPIDSIPLNAVTDLESVMETYTVREYTKKDVITMEGFHQTASAVSGLKDPIEVSIGMDNPAQVVGGTVREGDHINIYTVRMVKNTMDQEEGGLNEERICEAIYLNAFVTGAYTASGSEVVRKEEGQEEQPATIITILLPMEAEREFQLAADNGTLRVSRICGL